MKVTNWESLHGPTPVIVGVGEVVQRSDVDPPDHPVALAALAARRAAEDAGGHTSCAEIDSLDLVNVMGWAYEDPAGLLAADLGCRPARVEQSAIGGHQPIRLIDQAAARIASGASSLALVAGAEAMASLASSMRGGTMPPWPPPPPDAVPVDARDFVTDHMAAHGLVMPTDVYPLYEQASRCEAGQTQAEARRWAASTWAAASEVASQNPAAWIRTARSADELAEVSPSNRMVSWPYPKLLTANLGVDQAAAVLLTSTDVARRMGVPEERWIFPWGGAGASEPTDVLARAGYSSTAAGSAAIAGALELAELDAGEVDLLELYSCFPCVPRMALRALGLPLDHPTTVTGGLTFFGGPGNDYMLHAAAAMVARLRAGDAERGLLYGQGGHVTSHHAMVLRRLPADRYRVDDADRRQAVVPVFEGALLDGDTPGEGVVETFALPYDREGQAGPATVVGRTAAGDRFVAMLEATDDAVAVLTHPEDEPVGRPVRPATGPDDRRWVELS